MISLVFCFILSFKGVKNEFGFRLSHHDSWWLFDMQKAKNKAAEKSAAVFIYYG